MNDNNNKPTKQTNKQKKSNAVNKTKLKEKNKKKTFYAIETHRNHVRKAFRFKIALTITNI